MTDYILINGIIFGLVLAAPVGPVGVLCVQRTLAEGRIHGLLSALGAAFGDALYGVVAAFGVSAVSEWITDHQASFRTIGGIVLLLLAARTFFWTRKNRGTQPASSTDPDDDRIVTESLVKDFISTFMLAITNPITVIAFAGLLATLGLTEAGASVGNASILVAGVFIGSAAWWVALSSAASFFRPMVDGTYQHWTDRISALVLAGFGVYALVTAFYY